MIKLLALDLDGTLLDSNGDIPEANKSAIARAEEAGVLVTIATGRRFRDARPVGLESGLNAPLLSHNGALMKYADTGETLAYSSLDEATSRRILAVGQDFGGDALVSVDPHGNGKLLYDRISLENAPLRKYIYWAKKLHGPHAEESILHVQNLEDELADNEVVHMSYSGTCEAMRVMEVVLREELTDSVTILSTIYPALDFTLIDILPPDASKGHGLRKLCELKFIEPSEVMAMGDNFNDLEMLEFAGTPVVMGNADAGLLERAEFYKTDTNNDNGVAAAIDRFILKQEN